MKLNTLLTSFLLLLSCVGFSQINITIGTGNSVNGGTTYPAPYGNWYFGAKHQILFTAIELNAAGMSSGDIYSLAFDVQTAEGEPLSGFQIKIGTTSKSVWSSGDNFETGLTSVFGPQTYTETNGLNIHTFSSPYYWDGVSNLVVQTCFNNTVYNQNAQVKFTTSSGNTVMYESQDAPGVCATNSGTFNLSDGRPNVVFSWQTPSIPPNTNFMASTTNTCSGQVSFTDISANLPTSWAWNFGDGGTSTMQNPSHTYSSTGAYTVTLVATNAFGSDTEVKTNYINVNLSGNSPIANSCTPATGDGTLGFGITNVTFNTINKNSANSSEGYVDFTCDQTTVYAGQTYSFSATHNAPTTHNCGAWIDWNNDGVFHVTNERIATSTSSTSTSSSVTIPSNAVLNTPLRMRVIADYDLNPAPTPCLNPGYGQAEDYTIIVEQQMIKPDADFEADITTTCEGTVEFTDLSTNIPYAWAWNFGDGGTSVQISPSHTYSTDGNYTVQLIVSNAYGTDTIIKTNYISVNTANDLTTASCIPATIGYCCDYGIYKVVIGSINNATTDAQDGYQDYSCDNFTTLDMGSAYNIEIRTGTDNPQDTKVWIDYNNDGSFDPITELVFTALNTVNPSGNINIPLSGVIADTYLRMRVSSDEIGSTLDACANHLRGQTEDYGISLHDPTGIESFEVHKFNLYPNPTKGSFTIDNSVQITQVYVLNLMGQVVISQEVNNQNKIEITETNHLQKGTYLVRIVDENQNITTQKLIKN